MNISASFPNKTKTVLHFEVPRFTDVSKRVLVVDSSIYLWRLFCNVSQIAYKSIGILIRQGTLVSTSFRTSKICSRLLYQSFRTHGNINGYYTNRQEITINYAYKAYNKFVKGQSSYVDHSLTPYKPRWNQQVCRTHGNINGDYTNRQAINYINYAYAYKAYNKFVKGQ
jgi:hypothetical protein